MDIGYARVSTTGQSLESQLDLLRNCNLIYQEKVSGATMDRPELDKLLHHVRKGDRVFVSKLDRLARSTKDLLEIVESLNKKQAALCILNMNLDTSTPTGRLMLTMLGAIAEVERGLMLERQSEGIARAKVEGKYKGRKPKIADLREQILDLKKQTFSLCNIAQRLDVSLATIYRALKTKEA
jgi:DNA invertase Pin-like site-specific DNA recombinase